jgi:hypothetical protein
MLGNPGRARSIGSGHWKAVLHYEMLLSHNLQMSERPEVHIGLARLLFEIKPAICHAFDRTSDQSEHRFPAASGRTSIPVRNSRDL